MRLLFLLFIFPLIVDSNAKHVTSYTESQIFNYIDRLRENEEVSKECARSLSRIIPLMNANSTLDQQRQFYRESFASGVGHQFLSRDLDRWFYKSMECIKVAGQMSYSTAEYPVSYCFGLNEERPNKVYGICIPSPCEDDRKILLKEWQTSVSKNKDILDYDGCTKSKYEQQWYINPIPLINFIIDHSITFLICLATVYDIKRGGKPRSTLGQIFIAWSWTGNLKKLIQLPKDPQSTISCMFGIRFICMVWTLVGHSFYLVQSFLSNVEEFQADLTNNFWNQWILNFTLGVDVFLTLSGILIGYSWFRKWHLSKNQVVPGFSSFGYWLRFYRHRLIRLWPAYLYALIMLTTRLSYTHWHPVFAPTDPAVQCPNHWYKNAFMINSLFGSLCMPWTWYISTEFIFYVLSPLFLLTLYKSQFFGISLVIATIFMSSIVNTITMYVHNFPPIPLSWGSKGPFNDDFLSYHFLLYIKPWNRIGPYLIGLLLGYYLATKLTYGNKKDQKSTKFILLGWFLSFAALFWALFGAYPAIQGWNWPIYHLFYGSTHRTVFSLGIAWLVYACHVGHARYLNAFLGSRVFLPLSSLSYSVYLIHMSAIAFTFLISPFPIIYNGKLPLFAHCVAQLIISYVLGGRVALAVELPALAIEKVFLSYKRELKPVELNETEETSKLKTAVVG